MSVDLVILQAGMDPVNVAVYVAGAVVYALASYFSKRTKPGGEPWSTRKFLRTVVIGIIVGLFAVRQGIVLNPANFWEIATAIGAPAIAERVVQIIYRLLRQIGVIGDTTANFIYPQKGRRRP